MDAEELSRRAVAFDGWFGPALARRLVKDGYLDELQALAEAGDWTCAQALAAELADRGEHDAALEVLAPYAATGWWPAVDTAARALDDAGRTGEAISLVSPLVASEGDRYAVKSLAELLASAGRTDEVLALLGPRTGDWWLARTLVDVTSGRSRDDEVLGLLPPLPERHNDCWNAAILRARVLERQGRADDAAQLLRSHIEDRSFTSVNDIEHLADLMARHGQLEQLREFTAGSGGEHAAYRLAGALAEQGQVDQAVEVLGPFLEDHSRNAAGRAAELLAEHGRADEAIEVLRPVVAANGYDCGCAVGMLADLLARQGRAAETVTIVDELAAREESMTIELLTLRAWALHQPGRSEQAIAELRAHPEAGKWYLAEELAALLADSGRGDDAIAVLRANSSDGPGHVLLADLLIQQGRIKEAAEAVRTPKPRLAQDPWADSPATSVERGETEDHPF